MSETKTYFVGRDGNDNNILSLLAPLLQQRGIDPNVLAALQCNGGMNNGSWFIWIIFLFIIFGFGGRNCFIGNDNCQGNANLANLINNNDGRNALMDAIQSNGAKLGDLAGILNCSTGQIQQAINALMGTVQKVGCDVNQGVQQVINAIQAGDCNIASQLANCCCELKQAIGGVNISLERGFSQMAFNSSQQTCEIKDAIRENTATVIAGQRAAEMRELNRELAERDRKIAEQAVIINNGQQTAIFGQMIQQATAPIGAAIGALQKDVDCLKCKMPESVNVPYSPVVGVPTCVAANYGLGFGLGCGFNNFNGWG